MTTPTQQSAAPGVQVLRCGERDCGWWIDVAMLNKEQVRERVVVHHGERHPSADAIAMPEEPRGSQ